MRPHRIFIRNDKRFVPQPCHQKIVRAVFLIFADKIFVVFRIYVFQFRYVHRLFPSGISPGAAFLFRRRLHYAAVSPLHCRSSAVQPERRFPRLWLLRRFLILPFYRKTAAKSIFFFLSSPLFSTTVQNSARSSQPRKPPRSVSTSRADKCARRRPAVPKPPLSGKPPPASCRRRPEPTPS